MVEQRKPITVTEAISRILARGKRMEYERVSLLESYGRILHQPIVAEYDIPRFNRSPYDGFAIRSQDSTGANGNQRHSFQIIDHIGAGSVSSFTLQENEAVRLMTGAALPNGADAVVMFEQATELDQSFTIRKPFQPLENVSLQGEDMKQGEVVMEEGHIIQPGTAALLATFGYGQVEVSKRPLVGIVVTGSELLEVDEPLQPGKIRNSNGPMIAFQLMRMGIPYKMYRMVADDLPSSIEQIKQAVSETDCLITTGGVSVGDFDFMPAVYEALQADVLFNKVAMRPGSVTTVAYADDTYLFGLSGNPSACYTGFELFVRPAILQMMGAKKIFLPHTRAVLGEDFTKANPFTRFVRAIYNGQTVVPAGFNKSNAVSSIAKGNAFLVLPGGTRGFVAGDEVDVLLLGVEEGSEEWKL